MSAESPPSSPGDGKNPLTFHVLSDPLGDLPADRRIELLGQIGVKAKNDFVSAIAGLDAQVLPYEPTLVLAWFAFYRLMSPGGVDREITEDEPLFPQHLEFLQAFVLRYAEAEFESKPPGPDDYQTLEETLKILSQSAGFRDFEKIKPDQSTEQRAKLHLASTLRVETQAIRNWGYPRQMQRIVKDLFEPLSAAFKERIGSSVTDLITMFERIEELISNRATSHAQAVGDIWQQKTLEEVLRASVRATSVDIDESDFRARMREHGLNLEQVKSMLSHHLDLFLPRVFTLTLDDLIECHPAIRDHGVMAELIGRLTYRFGDLQKEDPDRFFVSNPVWKRPFVSTDAGYLFVNINVCTAFLVEIVEGLIGDDVKLRSRYDRRRGVFLEEETAKQFRQAFPEAQHARRSTWADETSGKEFENDLTVVVDAYLFVVESKGGRLTEAARRGGEARIVVYSLSRFSRSTEDHFAIRALLLRYGVRLYSVTEPIDDSPAGRLMETMTSAIAQFDNDVKAERTRTGMLAAAERGRWVFQPPLGYRMGEKRLGPSLVPDGQAAPLVRKAFDLFASGSFTMEEIRDHVNRLGLRTRRGRALCAQSIDNLLRNPVYAGFVEIPQWGVRHRGDFEALIPEATYDLVQARLNRRRIPQKRRLQDHPDFPLRRFVRCEDCAAPVTGAWVRGKGGSRFAYYWCRSRGCRAFSARRDDLEDRFVEFLEQLQPEARALRLVLGSVREAWDERHTGVREQRKAIQVRIDGVEEQRRKLVDAFVYHAKIDQKLFDEESARLAEQVAMLRLELSDARLEEIDIEGVLNFAEHLLGNAGRLWKAMDADARRKVQAVLLPEGVTFDGEVFRTPKTCLGFGHLGPISEGDTAWVSPGGFEPPSQD